MKNKRVLDLTIRGRGRFDRSCVAANLKVLASFWLNDGIMQESIEVRILVLSR